MEKMTSKEDHLNKMRLERVAREKARIEKLRELNLKKYSNVKNVPVTKRSTTDLSIRNNKTTGVLPKPNDVGPNAQTGKPRPSTIPRAKKVDAKPKTAIKTENKPTNKENIPINNAIKDKNKATTFNNSEITKKIAKPNVELQIPAKIDAKIIRKSVAPSKSASVATSKPKTMMSSRKTIDPSSSKSAATLTNTRESVFDRLYKPKIVPKKQIDEVQKLKTDPNYFKKVIQNAGLILNKRNTVFENRPKVDMPVRRSISAVHFKKISKSEINNCIHKWSSIGDKLDTAHLDEINEDENITQDRVISAVKSERKKVKFLTPVPSNFNTPRADELQARLKSWLQKRGKSLTSYHHLQCFGIHHLSKPLEPLHLNAPKYVLYDDENKENIAVESDSDDGSFKDNMNDGREGLNGGDKVDVGVDKWRSASFVSDFNDSSNSTLTAGDVVPHVDELLLGALDDLTELLREGFDWEESARLLRAIRERFPTAPNNAAYWECRAALEERRGDLPASLQCWQEAIVKGTEHSKAEASLDNLLDKFMQLKISPNSGKRREVNVAKMVDVKNVFKSTIIRFAVKKSKQLRQSNQLEVPSYTVTPVRRSSRLSVYCSGSRTPLQICTSVRQADRLTPGHKPVFVPNDKLCNTP